MKRNLISFMLILFSCMLILAGCKKSDTKESNTANTEGKIKIVTTTTMLKDLIEQVGGDKVEVTGLMGEGVDPHLYKATAADVEKLKSADVIVYQGLHLEGSMGNIFSELKDKKVIEAGKGIDPSKLKKEEDGNVDPHIWFDPELWGSVGKYISSELANYYPNNKTLFEQNFDNYNKKLLELDSYIKNKVGEVAKEQRVLVTAHDAFSYFADRYGFEVMSIQGISTESEATTSDISNLAEEISKRKIKAIFVESSVSDKTIKSLKEAINSKGHQIELGGELYSDSLGDKKNNTEDYIKTSKANVDTIVNALK